MKHIKTTCALLVFFLSCSVILFCRAEQPRPAQFKDIFEKASAAYQQEKYDEALSLYEQVATGGLESGNLLYNLGNCYFKKAEYPKAVLYYEKALRFIPRDPDVRSNYEYALSFISHSYQEPKPSCVMRVLTMIFGGFTMHGLLVMLTAANVCLFLFLTLRMFIAVLKRYSVYFLAPCIILLFCGWLYYAAGAGLDGKEAILLTKVETKFEPQSSATTYFTMFAGEKVIVVAERGEWVKIKRLDGMLGWIPAASFAKI